MFSISSLGSLSQTNSWYPCQHWNSQWPQKHSYTPIYATKNYCTNEDDLDGPPWCYVNDPNSKYKWDYCLEKNDLCPETTTSTTTFTTSSMSTTTTTTTSTLTTSTTTTSSTTTSLNYMYNRGVHPDNTDINIVPTMNLFENLSQSNH